MSKFIERAKVLLGALPTYLTTALALVIYFKDEIVTALPEGWQDEAGAVAVTLISLLTAAVLIVRKVAPVHGADVGLLVPPPKDG